MFKNIFKTIKGWFARLFDENDFLNWHCGDTAYFGHTRYLIDEHHEAQLDAQAAYIQKKNVIIYITGHADETEGTPAFCSELSRLRAMAWYTALVNRGVARENLSVHSVGSTDPLTTEFNEMHLRALNRRVTLFVVPTFMY